MLPLNYSSTSVTRALYEIINGQPLPATVTLPDSDLIGTLSDDAPSTLWDRVPSFTNTSYILPKWGVEVAKLLPAHYPLYLYGASGTGKSTIIRYLASVFKLPFYEVTAHNRLESPELIGSYQLRNGQTVWQDGPLTRALRSGGIFLINELSLLDPSTATGLNTILDGAPLVIAETSEVIPQHPYFYFVATDNTNGQGDDTGLFLGTLCQNQALMGRFILLEAQYLEPDVEAQIIKKSQPSLPQLTVENMIQYATENRQALTNSTSPLTNPITTRDLLKWATLLVLLRPLANKLSKAKLSLMKYTLDRAYIMRLNAGDRVTAEELYNALFGLN